jgi:hypothetical protein
MLTMIVLLPKHEMAVAAKVRKALPPFDTSNGASSLLLSRSGKKSRFSGSLGHDSFDRLAAIPVELVAEIG